jgi:hypothetical protein
MHEGAPERESLALRLYGSFRLEMLMGVWVALSLAIAVLFALANQPVSATFAVNMATLTVLTLFLLRLQRRVVALERRGLSHYPSGSICEVCGKRSRWSSAGCDHCDHEDK